MIKVQSSMQVIVYHVGNDVDNKITKFTICALHLSVHKQDAPEVHYNPQNWSLTKSQAKRIEAAEFQLARNLDRRNGSYLRRSKGIRLKLKLTTVFDMADLQGRVFKQFRLQTSTKAYRQGEHEVISVAAA